MNRRTEKMKTHHGPPSKFACEMWTKKDKIKTERQPLLESNWIRDERGASDNRARRGGANEGEGREGHVFFLANPMLHTQELIQCKNGRAELGEELLNPQAESLFLDPEIG